MVTSLQAPAVTLRESRFPDHPTVVVSDTGIRYAGGRRENQIDQDFQVLWERWGGSTDGAPVYGMLDPQVQREAADRLLCAYCLQRPDRAPDEGMLWLLDVDAVDRAWPADIETTTPPICRPHAELALARCATLRRGYLAVQVKEVERAGVLGTLYSEGGPGGPDELVRFTEADRLRFVLARYLVLALCGAVPDSSFHPGPAFRQAPQFPETPLPPPPLSRHLSVPAPRGTQ
ncbi:hypothetical protein [Streptomyces xanthophaeus]